MHELLDAFDQADADDEVRAVVVTGRGGLLCRADLSGGAETFTEVGSDVATDVGVPRDGGGLVRAADLRVDQARPSAPSMGQRSGSW